MTVGLTIRVPAALRELTAGEPSVRVVTAAPATVATVLDTLAISHPALERRVRDELGALRPHVNLFVDADNVRDLDGLRTAVREGQTVSIVPAVSGG